MIKSCWSCKHFSIGFEGDYSEITPGAGFWMTCAKNKFPDTNDDELTQARFANAMEIGLNCDSWESKK